MNRAWSQPGFEAVAQFICARTGLVFAPRRCDDAEAGIRRAMARAKVTDTNQYLARLEVGELGLDDLVDELTVGETYFFRDLAHFDFIRREVIPGVVARRGPAPGLRVWSAGCASGEEAYSLGIVVAEAGLADPSVVLGTDISPAALARARAASYGRWSLRGVDAAVIRRYFAPSSAATTNQIGRANQRWTLDPQITKTVTFELLNLARDSYPSPATRVWGMDLILCRNVLIYFDEATVASVAQRLHATLADDGWLCMGPSDPALGDKAPFETVITTSGVHYRKLSARGRAFSAIPMDPSSSGSRPIEPVVEPTADPIDAVPDLEFQFEVEVEATALPVAPPPADPKSCTAQVVRIHGLANSHGSEFAAQTLAIELQRQPLVPELHYLHALLLQDLGRDHAAVRAVKHTLYLDQSLAAAHFLLASILVRLGDVGTARRSYRRALDLAAARPADEPLMLTDGERADALVIAAAAALTALDAATEDRS